MDFHPFGLGQVVGEGAGAWSRDEYGRGAPYAAAGCRNCTCQTSRCPDDCAKDCIACQGLVDPWGCPEALTCDCWPGRDGREPKVEEVVQS